MNIIKWFIRIAFWIQAFASPVILFGLIALWVDFTGEKYLIFAIALAGIGVVAGIIVAEYIRRKIGLETFFARLYGPNEMDETKETGD